MKDLVCAFLERRLSRRGFARALAALGVCAAGVKHAVRAARAAEGDGRPAETVTGTGGQLLVAQMRAAGVRYLFTNPGSFEAAFFDAFAEQDGMELIMGLHEGLVIAMADGYHKVSGRPAFVNVHVIAGTAQAAGQMYNASRDGSALVVTAGLLDNEVFHDDLILGPRPGYNQKDVNRQFTRLSAEAHDPRGVALFLRRAFKVATTAPGGPVYLAFPNTVLEARATADVYDRGHFLLPNDVPPDPARLTRIARLLLAAKAPALVLGDEVWKSGAQPEALELAELLGMPVHEPPLPAFHNFPRRHGLFAGKFVSHGKDRGRDVVVNVGDYDLGDYDATEYIDPVPRQPFYEKGTRVVRMGLNTEAIGRTNPFDEVVVANVKLALRGLILALKAEARKGQLDELRRSRWDGAVGAKPPRVRRGTTAFHPDELGAALEATLAANAVVVSENLSGSNHFLSTGFRDNEKTWVTTSGAGLGWGVGAATGAKLAAPDRQVVCNIGDGSVMYSAAGFWTQARYEVPVLTVVCNNRNYQTVRGAYFRYGGTMQKSGHYLGMYLGDPDIDFVKLADSQGVQGVRVEKGQDLVGAIKQGIKATDGGRPFLVEVVVECLKRDANDDPNWHESFSLAQNKRRKKG
jgi:thiamine pyrophosphate-dependent acetolactate synthase large subunit-like protein